MAPFYDMNGDGIYNPYDKDYPLIPGDQAVYFIYNDNLRGAIHGQTNGQHLGTEIHGMAYAFACTADSALNNTIFINYTIINRSLVTYYNCYVGMWTDFDIGYSGDDYVGCDVSRNAFYAYNGNNNDGNGGPGTYGNRTGAQGVVVLQGPEADISDGIDNNENCIVDEPGERNSISKFISYNNDASIQGNPSVAYDYYNYMRGIWRDNTPITYGGVGHNTGTPCDYMFPDISDQQYGWGFGGTCQSPVTGALPWSEITGNDPPGDRRGLASS